MISFTFISYYLNFYLPVITEACVLPLHYAQTVLHISAETGALDNIELLLQYRANLLARWDNALLSSTCC